MGNKILVPYLDVIIIAFFPEKYTVKDHIFNTKLEKDDHYYIQTWKNVLNSAQKYKQNVLMPPWASHNTPSIELIQYGHGIS